MTALANTGKVIERFYQQNVDNRKGRTLCRDHYHAIWDTLADPTEMFGWYRLTATEVSDAADQVGSLDGVCDNCQFEIDRGERNATVLKDYAPFVNLIIETRAALTAPSKASRFTWADSDIVLDGDRDIAKDGES